MPDHAYRCLHASVADGIARATIDHPPLNLLDAELIVELAIFGAAAAADPDVRVVIVDSADPDFFAAHADVTMIHGLDTSEVAAKDEPNGFQAMADRFRTMPKATIAVIAGVARGGGSELALSFDMRFAARDRAVLAQPEVALGLIPGGTGTQRLPSLVGRGRALEIILGCGDIDAETAERWGYVNRALPLDELGPFVDDLASRIATFPAEAIAKAKAAVAAAQPDPLPGMLTEDQLFRQSLGDPETGPRMDRFMRRGSQTREVELTGFPLEDLAE
jgi:enoyl-CoA hydratase/carnithine racemase